MTIRFLHEATLEFLDAITFYENEAPGLGRRFRAEVEESLKRLRDYPESSSLTPGGYRRMPLRVFPYQIIYVTRHPILWVIAIPHQRREPEYWIDRKDV